MIIDTHVHMFDGGWPPLSEKGLSASEMIYTMDKHNIEKVWISSVSALVKDFRENNDRLFEFTGKYCDRMVNFFTVNPNYPEEALQEMDRCTQEFGCRGLKLHPWLQAFSLTFDIVDRIMEKAEKYNTVVLFHDGTPPYCDTVQVAHLASRYPKVRMILGHSGLLDSTINTIKAAINNDNIYLCLCGTSIGDTAKIAAAVDNSRILFGSDFGTSSVKIINDRIKIVDYAVKCDSTKGKIFYTNAAKLIP